MGLSFTLRADDNFPLTPGSSKGNSYFFDTGLNFGISSVTRAHSLNLTGSGVLRFGDIPGRSVAGFENPALNFTYTADAINGKFSTTLGYSDVDREFLDPFKVEQEDLISTGFVGDGGNLRRFDGGLHYETGLQRPVTLILDYKHSQKDYSNVTNSRLFDTDQDKYQATVLMQLNPVTKLSFDAGLTQYQAQDSRQTNRTTTDYSIGLIRDLDKALVLDARIGHTTVDTDTIFGTANRSGMTGALTLTKTLPDGKVYGTISTTQSQNGGRTTLKFGRDFQFRTDTLSASLGLTKGDIGSTDWIGTLAYTHRVQASDFSLSISRSATINVSDEEIVNTRLGLGYGYAINSISRLDVTYDWGRSEDGGLGAAPTIDRTSLRTTYTRQLTNDWNLKGGFQIRGKSETGIQDAQSHSLFLTLDRQFSFRP